MVYFSVAKMPSMIDTLHRDGWSVAAGSHAVVGQTHACSYTSIMDPLVLETAQKLMSSANLKPPGSFVNNSQQR